MAGQAPRLVIAGLSGDSGKTLLSLSLLTALRRKGLSVSAFKKGPDYIDSAWLSWASQRACRNLDTYLVAPAEVLRTFCDHSADTDIALVEGNRGLFDGKGSSGAHSTARLAVLLQAPVVLVVNASRVTRTLAAIIKGCMSFEPDLNVAGVILNRIAGERHRKTICDSIEEFCRVPVLGAVPRVDCATSLLPSRHLGLVTPAESGPGSHQLASCLEEIAERYLHVDRLLEIARKASPLDMVPQRMQARSTGRVKIGYFRDSAFTFYYPENLEALEAEGADLVRISSLHDMILPDIDALYIGGGFPEVHADMMARNRSLMESVRKASEAGLPIYAECGGLIYLSRSITFQSNSYPMAGVFDITLDVRPAPVGHGYSWVRVDRPCPFFPIGTEIRGHEFHYSGSTADLGESAGCMAVIEGVGLGNGRDGFLVNNTLACYTHLHARGVPDWAASVVSCAERYRQGKQLLQNSMNDGPIEAPMKERIPRARPDNASGLHLRPIPTSMATGG